MRIFIPAGALVTAVTASLLLAPSALATPKGDNGTVKIHDAKTGEELRRNEPKVCSFYLDAFGFDAAQKVQWHIEAWANNDLDKGETVKTGAFALDGSGHGRTSDMTLPNGQYKLFWNFEGENGKAKHKVFKTDCEPGKPGEEPTKPGEEPTKPGEEPTKPGEEPTKPGEEPTKPGEEPSATPSTSPSAPGGEQPSGAPSPSESTPAGAPATQGGASGNLAETGSSAPVGTMAAVAAVLAAAGGFLVMRRRKAQQH
ncbi:LPXTG cell wall anchor domain-containing protein [Streptomyces sp. NPDC051286]|uniref:LPXTG cell wall anchor domain-containing protein n=1 Tax=Streptomyces sp. NPDC051286 TaxID=3365647 RepID=UPI0037A6EC7C